MEIYWFAIEKIIASKCFELNAVNVWKREKINYNPMRSRKDENEAKNNTNNKSIILKEMEKQ